MDTIKLSPEALAALDFDKEIGRVAIPKPLDPRIIKACQWVVTRLAFGPSMEPTMRQRLFMFSSFIPFKNRGQ